MTSASPSFAEFLNNLSEAALIFADTEGIELFFDTLNKGFDVLRGAADVFDSVFGEGSALKVVTFVGAVVAVTRALSLMGGIANSTAKIILGGPLAAFKNLGKVFDWAKIKMKGKPDAADPSDEEALEAEGRKLGDALTNGIAAALKDSTEVRIAVADLADDINDALQTSLDLVGGISLNFKTAGEWAVEGFVQGLRTGKDDAVRAVNDLADEVVDALKKRLGIKSPSTVFAQQGEFSGEGYEDGLRSKIDDAYKAGQALGEAAENGAQSARITPAAGAAAVQTGRGAAGAGSAAAASAGVVAVGGGADKAAKSAGKVGGAFTKLGGVFKSFGGAVMGLLGGPLGLLLVAIPLIVLAFKKLYEKSPEFRKFVDGIVNAVKPLIEWIGTHLVGVLNAFFSWVNEKMPAVKKVVGDAFTAIAGFVTGTLVPIFNTYLIPAFRVLWEAVQRYIGFVVKFWRTAFDVIRFVIMNVVLPVINNFLIPTFKFLWYNVVKPIFNAIKNAIQTGLSIIKWVWNNVVSPYIGFIRSAYKSLWENVVKPVFGSIKDRISNTLGNIKAVWEKYVSPTLSKLRTGFQNLWDKVKAVFSATGGGIRAIFSAFKTAFQSVWTKVSDLGGKIRGVFGGIRDAIGAAFSNIGGRVAGGINAFIRFLNTKLIANINRITKKFGLTIASIPTISVGKKARGGRVTGVGGPMQDNLPHMLSRDEYVVRTRAAKKIGYRNLEYLNAHGRLPPGTTAGTGGIDVWPGDFGKQLKAVKGGADKIADLTVELASKAVGGVKNVGTSIAKHGLGKVLGEMIDIAGDGMAKAKISKNGGTFLQDFFYGVMEALEDQAREWGGSAGKQAGGVPGGVASGAMVAKSGWAYPLSRRYGITQYPNAGHSPSWSVDIGSPSGTPVLAAATARVLSVIDKGGTSYGRYIVLQHAAGIRTLYAHLSSWLVRSGQTVRAGQKIGYSGSTGNSTGPHLHFELMPSSNTVAAMLARGVRLAKGGIVPATPGGVLSVIGEAGRNERVEPLDPRGMSNRDRAMIDLIQQAVNSGQANRGDTFHVHPAPGMNEEQLASMVSRRVAWRRSVGT
jgi:murein DD-endopeptidase MepM/ murein hydrolase activator NlpD